MVLILTDQFDTHADIVVEKLEKRAIPYFRLNLDVESLKNTYVSFDGSSWDIYILDQMLNTKAISCVWCRRPFVELTLQEQVLTEVDFRIWKNEWNKTLLGLYNSIKYIPWLNPLRKAYKGENKYYQMEIAKKIGLLLPDTLISNEKDKLMNFVQIHRKAILKLMSQEIYTQDGEFKGFYTNLISVDDLEAFCETEENPIVLQKYIDKAYEVRYTIVGEKGFACRIDSQQSEYAKYDWRRYDIPHTPHMAIEIPLEIELKAKRMLLQLGLEFGAFDFIVTPNDDWFFLEINCMGQWLWIEQLTGLPISDAIVEWLCNHQK